jgi:hypothetical protein
MGPTLLVSPDIFGIMSSYAHQGMATNMELNMYGLKRDAFSRLYIKGLKIRCWIKARFGSFAHT